MCDAGCMAQIVCPLVSAEDRARLEAIVADRNRAQKHVARARIILHSADRLNVAEVAKRVGVGRRAVWRWQRRFALAGVDSLCATPPASPASLGWPRWVPQTRASSDPRDGIPRLLQAAPGPSAQPITPSRSFPRKRHRAGERGLCRDCLPIVLPLCHHGPDDARHLVGQSHGDYEAGSSRQQALDPRIGPRWRSATNKLVMLPFQMALSLPFVRRHVAFSGREFAAAHWKSAVVTTTSAVGPLWQRSPTGACTFPSRQVRLRCSSRRLAGRSGVLVTRHPVVLELRRGRRTSREDIVRPTPAQPCRRACRDAGKHFRRIRNRKPALTSGAGLRRRLPAPCPSHAHKIKTATSPSSRCRTLTEAGAAGIADGIFARPISSRPWWIELFCMGSRD